ncbi:MULTISPECIES: DUF5701 family protein [unclassified Streptomyces]|uniref:DUF5701 family protein n=1 Tax=unclassified Streptomyces TaxID=2593676 RepID=UPI001BE920E9|nr:MULTISPECIES: DUF5701 family protein [unclassified Streptomyces]MBT2406197.1 hypothetical protein [Streptomyces sp. ISL-21]MBT2459020.1 hypothetical protein [Streptomyces sp. ISL-86]MBT2609497.1 hypothetical protein [Streptomyces sp. ISL-87]
MTGFDAAAEFDRQVATLAERGYPGLARMGETAFRALVTPLREQVLARAVTMEPPTEGRVPFLLVVTRALVPIEESLPLTTLAGKAKPGVIERFYAPGELERFVSIPDLALPDGEAYIAFDVDRGEEFCNAVPLNALAAVAERGRTPLTMEEGIAFITQYPEALAKNKCFSLGGTRLGDRRVPALWISKGAPKLGWCWEANPHTWLGLASTGDRSR